MSTEIRVAEDPATEVAELLTHAAVAGGNVVLTGGSSPKRAYELAAERDADWSSATVWFNDERCVPPEHPDSNFGMAELSCGWSPRPGCAWCAWRASWGPTRAPAPTRRRSARGWAATRAGT